VKTFAHALLLVLFSTLTTVASADPTYPNRAIRWVVPYPAGGGSDALARMIMPELSKRLGVPVVIENKPGAASAIAASEVARSAPDGYTILNADVGTLVYNPALFKKLSYDPAKDFRPVSLLIRLPTILVIGPGSPANSVKELFELVKAQPGKISYGSAGPGSPHAMAMELLKAKVGLDMVHVPYRGGALSLQDVASGQIPMTMTDFAGGGGMIKSGKVRPLAVATAKRMEQLPDVPTFEELGYPGIHAAVFTGIVVPAATPNDIVLKLQKGLQEAVAEPSVRARLVETGHEPIGGTAEQFAAFLQQETPSWHKLIKDLNLSLD